MGKRHDMTHGRFEGVVGVVKWVQSSHCDSAANTDSNKSKSRIPYADQKRRKELSSGIGYATVIRRKIFELGKVYFSNLINMLVLKH